MVVEFPNYVKVDYTDGKGQSAEDYHDLEHKLEKSIQVVSDGLEQYESPAIMWTGGKDSTLLLYVIREVARERGEEVPPVVFLDHFAHFSEIIEFVDRWAKIWNLDLIKAQNEDIANLRERGDQEIKIEDLNDANRKEIQKLGYEEQSVIVDPDSFVGNHLLKTAVLNETIIQNGFDGIFSGVRWDEQEARSDETFFSPRHDFEKYPPHDRIHPILQFDERNLWDAIWKYVVPDSVEKYPVGHIPANYNDFPDGISIEDGPVGPKYFEGFRALGTETGSMKSENKPAWLQDLEETPERQGRAQDKEGIMQRLRDLGYM